MLAEIGRMEMWFIWANTAEYGGIAGHELPCVVEQMSNGYDADFRISIRTSVTHMGGLCAGCKRNMGGERIFSSVF